MNTVTVRHISRDLPGYLGIYDFNIAQGLTRKIVIRTHYFTAITAYKMRSLCRTLSLPDERRLLSHLCAVILK